MDASLHGERLRAFLSVADEGGFSRAARKLGQSQSSVSQAVRALEDELGEQLVVRQGRGSALTAVGQLVRDHARRVFDELARMTAAIEARRELKVGRLSLGTSDTLATYVLPPVFARFRAQYPDIELALDNRPSPALAERVAARSLDLAVVSLPLPANLGVAGKKASELLHIEPLGPQRDVLIVPPDHALRGESVRLAELANHPLVLLDRTTSTRALLDARFRELGITPRVTMEMSSVEVLKRLVELGFGLSVVPEVAARRELAQRSLRALHVRGLGRDRKLGLVVPRTGALSHAARAFRDVLVRSLAQGDRPSSVKNAHL
jgi:DNA-binding transcriptional LysR family regulator